MENLNCVQSQNGDNKLLAFIPEFKITRLTKIKDPRSLPSSPQCGRTDVKPKPNVPDFLTLGRKSSSRKISDDEFGIIPNPDYGPASTSDSDELEKIRSILSGLDLAKYRRRSKGSNSMLEPGHQRIQRSFSAQPHVSSERVGKKAFLDGIPPPPKTKSMLEDTSSNLALELTPVETPKTYSLELVPLPRTSRKASSKLKELTEKLRPASAPPSPHSKLKSSFPQSAPPTSTFTFWREPLPLGSISNFSEDENKRYENLDDSCENNTKRVPKQATHRVISGYATLPRMKVNPAKDTAEPKTLACLDLNVCFEPLQRNHLETLTKHQLPDTDGTFEDGKEIQNSLESNEIDWNRNHAGKSRQRKNFDLNFVKFGSLTYPQGNGKENLEAKIHFKKSLVDSKARNGEAISKLIKPQGEMESESSEVRSGTKNTLLEEEIRTIAKLLDGKESLFLKLIESSKTDVDDGGRCFSPPPNDTPLSAPVVSMPQAENDNSPRLRAMTVAGSNPNRPAPAQKTPAEQKRYYKKRLRGPYGEMLEQEMSKSLNKPRPSYAKDLEFLQELDQNSGKKLLHRSSSQSLDETHTITVDSSDGSPKRKTSTNIPIVDGVQDSLIVPPVSGTASEPALHIRSHSDTTKASSSWDGELINRILRQSSHQDTRTHIVGELYETEVSYVESLQIILRKYMIPLKSSEHSGIVESSQVDEIFSKVPEILQHHEAFLDVLRQRLVHWDTKQKIGDVFVDVFTQQSVVDNYIAFINNWKQARDSLKTISQAKPVFAKFLENTSREHKGKLSVDALLIMPVQRIPRYELLIKELLKHTPLDHPDYKQLLQAQKEVHDLAVSINKVEREALEQEQMVQKVKDVEQLIEGVVDLVQDDRAFIKHDFVFIPGGLGIRKERCLFLFSDLLLISSVKRKGAAMRKSSIPTSSSPYGSLESNKYKLLMKTSLHNVEIIKNIDEPCVRKFLKEISSLESDVTALGKINDMLNTLNCPHQALDDALQDILSNVNRQLADKQASSSQLLSIDLAIKINDDVDNITAIFPTPELRMTWEAAFLDAKEKLDLYSQKNQPPEFQYSLPIRKSRSGLQITCAAAVLDSCQSGLPDVWICSSDGYIGQVCVLTFQNEPVIASCTSVSNARILCITAVPGLTNTISSFALRRRSTLLPHLPGFKFEKLLKYDSDRGRVKNFPLDSESDDEDFIDATDEDILSMDDSDPLQPTMWLGTEDGYIYVFNCVDVKLKNVKFRIQHATCIYDIVHVDEKILVSLANGELVAYTRDMYGWNTNNPQRVQIASTIAPITKMVLIHEKLWCATLNSITIINTSTLEIEHTFQVGADLSKHVISIVPCDLGVWISIQNSPSVLLYHAISYCELLDVNVTTSVTKMLTACDDIIRQHKLACLRVSALCVEKNFLWIGTSAGVVLNLVLPTVNLTTTELEITPKITGMSHGHSGHVRFLTSIGAPSTPKDSFSEPGPSGYSKDSTRDSSPEPSSPSCSALVISGGDGCENFSYITDMTAGRTDGTNHLLMWRV